MKLIAFLLALLFVVVLCCLVAFSFVMAKNAATFGVRWHFLHQPDYPRSYGALPSYREMLLHPAHWHRWTAKQWQRWIEERAE